MDFKPGMDVRFYAHTKQEAQTLKFVDANDYSKSFSLFDIEGIFSNLGTSFSQYEAFEDQLPLGTVCLVDQFGSTALSRRQRKVLLAY